MKARIFRMGVFLQNDDRVEKEINDFIEGKKVVCVSMDNGRIIIIYE